MAKYSNIIYLVIIFGSWNLSCSTNNPLKEGIISYRKYFKNIVPGTSLPMPDNLSGKIWFKDSSVIYEVKVLNIITNYTDSGIEQKESFDIYKYTYLDLRTLICQDYYSFSDTSSPICSYALKSGDEVVWNFYAEKKANDLFGTTSVLTDTLITDKICKRILVTNKDYGYEYTYFLNCNGKSNIFHLNRSLEELYPGCKVLRSEFRELNSSLISVLDLNIISEGLNSNENKILNKWEENAKMNKLPVLTLNEVYKLYPSPPPKK